MATYNSQRTMRGTAIGTILTWTGDTSAIPAGWIRCQGQELEVTDYPLLYEVIGTKYGGVTNQTFVLPAPQGRTVADFHSTMVNNFTIPTEFANLIGLNGSNSTNTVRTTDIDLYAEFNRKVNNFLGFVNEVSLNDPNYFDTITTVGRALSDAHLASHSHPKTQGDNAAFDVAGTPTSWMESCEQGGDQCAEDSPKVHVSEQNNPADERQRLAYFDGTRNNGENVGRPGGSVSSPGGWAARYTPGNAADQNGNLYYNYVDENEMDTYSSIQNPWSYAAVATNSAQVNWVSNSGNNFLVGHTHPPMFYSLNKGTMNVPATILTENISMGDLAPINEQNEGIGDVEFDMRSGTLTIQYLIRAY